MIYCTSNFIYYSKRMNSAVLIVAIITCVFVAGQAQTQNCVTRLAGLNSCTSQLLPGATQAGDFCSDCNDRLISYYRDCLNGTQAIQQAVDAVQRSKLIKQLAIILLIISMTLCIIL